jgi:hypothetical protein
MKRIAKCHCGELSVQAVGEPSIVLMCHCEFCQRRTGSSYNLGASFAAEDITVHGDAKQYNRTGETNSPLEFFFCPNCGTSVYWKAPEIQPGRVIVAAGCFADPSFPAPSMSLYAVHRHDWISMPSGVPSFMGGRDSEAE